MATIYLTAGHHLKDSGAVANGYKENMLTIEFRDLIESEIKLIDPSVKVWKDNDNLTLSQVIKEITKTSTADDLLLETHFDSYNGIATGTTVLVAANARMRSRQFAEDLAIGVSGTIGIKNRGVKNENESQHAKLGILHTKASSALLEVGFIDNKSDMQKYQNNKQCVAKEVALIIIKHLNNGK